MRRIVTFNHMSADGYFTGADGNLDWVVQDDEVYKASREGNREFDTMLSGAGPTRCSRPSGRAPSRTPRHRAVQHGGERSPAVHDMAVWINEATKVVFSRTRKDVTWKNSRLLRELDPREIEAMKQQPGKDMIVFGSGSVTSQLTQHGLIDEYMFVVSPVILGNGRTLLSGLPKSAKVDFRDLRKFSSGVVLLCYARPS